MPRRLTWLDVFTAEPLLGNQLAVVHDADGLSEDAMGRFAAETNLSETTFVQVPEAAGADYRNRIWMPHRELPFAGHPSLGTAVAVALARGEAEATYVQQTQPGLQAIDVRLDGARGHASMLQDPASFGPELDAGRVLEAMGLAGADADPDVPCQVVSTGFAHVMAPIADPAALGRVRPDPARMAALLDEAGQGVVYLAARAGAGEVRARGFFLQDGLPREDPGTGSAAGPLMAHLHARVGWERMRVVQGVEMRRTCVIDCAVEGEHVRVGGDVAVVFESRVAL
ncbi:MAG: PhzF family phenazine biosynthesis protein [Solirubrobacteraceae bacterium]|nr:PhzF family phenazine biosynthesis protein [Solirubrobacteraceae bacterium]